MRGPGPIPIEGNIFPHWIFLFSYSKSYEANIDNIAILVYFEKKILGTNVLTKYVNYVQV